MAGLPWFAMWADMPDHTKSVRLCRRLKNPLAWAYVVKVWSWCARFQQDGRFSGEDAAAFVEHAAGWTKDPGALLAALLDVGYVERDGDDLIVHGWLERNGAHVRKHAKDNQKPSAKYRSPPENPAGGLSGAPRKPLAGEGEGDRHNKKQLPCSEAGSLPPKAGPEVGDPALFPQHPPQQTTANGAAKGSGHAGKAHAAPKPTDPRQAEKRGAFERLFLELRGEPYYWQGAKDYGAVNRLIAVHLDEWERRARVGLTATDFQRRVSTVAELGMRWNALAGTGPPNGAMRALAAAEPHESFTSRKVILPP